MPLWASGYRNLLPNRRRMMEAGQSSGQSYTNKMLGYNPTTYWIQSETSGTTAVCQVNTAQNGTYARNVTTMGTGTGIGDGNTAPDFDGANDVNNVYSAALNTAFDGDEGSILTWIKVSGAGVWTDSTLRVFFHIQVDVNNYVSLRKPTTNNLLSMIYRAGGTSKTVSPAYSGTGWTLIGLTWSASADETKAYINGSQVGSTQTGLGVWSGGALISWGCCVGANTTVPANIWDGLQAHAAIFDSVLSGPEMSDLASV